MQRYDFFLRAALENDVLGGDTGNSITLIGIANALGLHSTACVSSSRLISPLRSCLNQSLNASLAKRLS